MTTSGDGGVCWTTPVHRAGDGFEGGPSTLPAHGRAFVARNANGVNRFIYQANKGYVGPDSLVFSLNPGGIILTVSVDVVPP